MGTGIVGSHGEHEHGARRLLAEIEQTAAAEAGGLSVELLEGYLDALLEAAVVAGRLSEHERQEAHSLGGRAAREGASLAAMVHLYLSATRLVWPHLPRLVEQERRHRRRAARVPDLGALVLQCADDALAAVGEGYTAARRDVVLQEQAERRQALDDLFSGRGDVSALLEIAERFDLRLPAPHVVVAVEGDRPYSEASPELSRVRDHLCSRLPGRETLVAAKDGRVVCVREGAGHVADDVVRLLERTADALLGTATWRVAVGQPHTGALGVARSYATAAEGLELARRIGLTNAAFRASDLQVYRVLLRDEGAMTELIDTVLQPLTSARGGAGPLLQTMSTYFASGQSTAETARRLHLSVRAVAYRLDRVQQLTGYRLDEPTQRLALEVATTGARLLAWPDRHGTDGEPT